MSIYGAMFSGVSGLNAQSQSLAMVSDNISNVNTVGYKTSKAYFSDLVTGQTQNNYAAGGVRSTPLYAIDRQQAAYNARCVGLTLDVLIEKPGKLPGQLVGRSPYLQPVHVMAPPELIGEVHQVTITNLGTYSLHGTLTRAAARAPELATTGV